MTKLYMPSILHNKIIIMYREESEANTFYTKRKIAFKTKKEAIKEWNSICNRYIKKYTKMKGKYK